MKAVVMHEFGGPEVLRYQDAEQPAFGDNEVLVRLHATSINPVDYKLRSGALRGLIDIDLPTILGRDLSGEVVQWGRNVTGLSSGLRVMALANGTYAEYTVAKSDVLAPIPDALSFEQAAALPLVVLTGAQIIERGVKPRPGQTVLVTGALGGVGRTAVHVARKHGARVLAGVRGRERDQAHALGADEVVAIDDEQAIGRLHELDAIADTVGGTTATQMLKTLRAGGVFATVLGAPQGTGGFPIEVRSVWAQPDASRLAQLALEAANGEFSIPIAQTMPLRQAAEAQQTAARGGAGGQIILTM